MRSAGASWRGSYENINSIQNNNSTLCSLGVPLLLYAFAKSTSSQSGTHGGYPGGNTAEGSALLSLTTAA